MHLKVSDDTDSSYLKVSVTSTTAEPGAEGDLTASPKLRHELRLNVRAVMDAAVLREIGGLTVEGLCLVDPEGNRLFGRFKRTSELLLHQEIYKANPSARAAVIHCHPQQPRLTSSEVGYPPRSGAGTGSVCRTGSAGHQYHEVILG
jgi:hypothetical protein